jgi:hypothetical protein
MLYFTKYAEQKFDILNKYKVFFTKEQVEDTVANAGKINKKRKYLIAKKDGVAVIYKKEDEVAKIITFYPIK